MASKHFLVAASIALWPFGKKLVNFLPEKLLPRPNIIFCARLVQDLRRTQDNELEPWLRQLGKYSIEGVDQAIGAVREYGLLR
ncbi:hypothetical protein BDN67DRAFT_963265 [Paxillus ammoniavirescens]|nr:hypothetical protein BDN67DRAFT_963265 [Paxillus ammoniavirescens]